MLPVDAPPKLPSAPIEISVTAENIDVGGGVNMGLLGLNYQRLFTRHWSAGLSAYGAATGDRGGFFAWGANGAYRQSWGPWQAETGLFVGGGGGSPSWVGGGLMVRPHLEVSRALGPWRLGLGASRVKFPNGQVNSSQPYASLRWTGERYIGQGSGADEGQPDAAWKGRAFESELVGVLGAYRPDKPPSRNGLGQQSSLRYGGLAYRRNVDAGPLLGGSPYVGLTALGALGGGYDGYAEFAGTFGLQWRLAAMPSLALRVEAGLGAGGAGATVDTGGGALAKVSGALVWQPVSTFSVATMLGRMETRGPFAARESRLELAWRFWDVLPTGVAQPQSAGPQPRVAEWAPWHVSLGTVRYSQMLRDDGRPRHMDMVALKLERQFGPNWRLVALANTATTGQAGGYAAGHIGVGWMSGPQGGNPLQLGLEASVGAAGGGSVTVNGGLIAQAQVQARYALSPDWALQMELGRLRGVRGKLESPMVGLNLVSSFSLLEGR